MSDKDDKKSESLAMQVWQTNQESAYEIHGEKAIIKTKVVKTNNNMGQKHFRPD